MNEEQSRQLYWAAVYKLREYVESGYASTEEMFEELEDDLERN